MNGRIFFILGLVGILTFGFFSPVAPFPADTIQGLYYPFKDLPTKYPNGIPYKNSLITDPIRQQFPWKYEAVRQIKLGFAPLWNPYNFSGTPLLANIQSAVFYPANLLFFLPLSLEANSITDFAHLWSSYIYLQTLLSFTFFYLYVRKLGMSKLSSTLGAISWTWCGYSTTWWEWGNIGHTILWFPLILWSIEQFLDDPLTTQRKWYQLPYSLFVLLFSLICSFLAGHWQSFSFIVINTLFYLTYRLPMITFKWTTKVNEVITLSTRRLTQWIQLFIVGLLFLCLISPQLLPSLEFINRSARAVDPNQWQRPDWFFPYQHLITFIAPDFFGNPTTQNYWGIWNYGEFTAYGGIVPLIFAFAMVIHWFQQQIANLRQKNNTLDITEANSGVGFFLFCAFINLFLITRNPLTEAPYQYALPFVSTAQPSRGIVMVEFSLAILATVGLHYFLKKRLRTSLANPVLIASGIICALLGTLWTITTQKIALFHQTEIAWYTIASSNLRLPTILAICSIALILIIHRISSEKNRATMLITAGLLLLTVFDLGRFFFKFNSFSPYSELYPSTPLTQQSALQTGHFMTDDDRLIAPNINSPYQISSVNGYDPLYSETYGAFIGLWVRDQPDLSPFPANRILVPHNPLSKMADVAGATHLYSFSSTLNEPQLNKLASYGSTSLYQRTNALPPYSLIPDVAIGLSDQSVADQLFAYDFQPNEKVILSMPSDITNLTSLTTSSHLSQQDGYAISNPGEITIQSSSPTSTTLNIRNDLSQGAVLYRTTAHDPNWSATLDQKSTELYRANLAFQAVIIPPGEHQLTFTYQPPSFISGLWLAAFGILSTVLLSFLRTKRDLTNG